MTGAYLTGPGKTFAEAAGTSFVDGNELAGALREIFAVDLTAAVGRCASCGYTGVIAETRVYDRAPGLVARCPGCTAVVLRLVRGPDRAWLDLSGMACLQVALPGEATSSTYVDG